MRKEQKTMLMLAQMEAICGSVIQQKSRKIIRPKPVRQGKLNKICSGCGHKNKKCTCSNKEIGSTCKG